MSVEYTNWIFFLLFPIMLLLMFTSLEQMDFTSLMSTYWLIDWVRSVWRERTTTYSRSTDTQDKWRKKKSCRRKCCCCYLKKTTTIAAATVFLPLLLQVSSEILSWKQTTHTFPIKTGSSKLLKDLSKQ